jgi:hypothetical protein
MRIESLTTFLDGKDRFEVGDIRTVDDERGARLVAAGWAKDLAGGVATVAPPGGPPTLDIQKSTLGVSSAMKGD